jgi:signal transduction histidine kinase
LKRCAAAPTRKWLSSRRLFAESVTISIADSGPGIPQEVHERLFKAFSTSKRTGMGLGLSISRSIAQNHGGDLTVDPRWGWPRRDIQADFATRTRRQHPTCRHG